MSDNNIPKPKRTYKKRAPKTTPKVVEDPPQPAVEKISPSDNSVEVSYNFYLCTKCDFSTQDNNPDCSNCDAKSSMRLYQTSSQQDAILEHEAYMNTVKASQQTSQLTSQQTSQLTSQQTSQLTSQQTSQLTSKNNLPAKYEKFILYGLYLINSIQSSNITSLNNDSNPFDIAHVFDNIHQQTLFVDSFLNQFKDIKASVKNEFKNRNNHSNDLLVNNIVNAANSIPLQIIIIDNVKFFITKDNKLLDFHTQRFIKHFIP
jgi:hypothetical protein